MRRRRQPQQARSQFKIEIILDAVGSVLREEGQARITTNRIAEAAGVSIGTLYQYFSNKQDIFTALHERQFKRMTESVRKAFVATKDGSLDDLLVTLMDAVIDERKGDPDTHRLLASTVPRKTETLETSHPLSVAFYESVASHKEELRKDCDLDRFVFILSHMITSLANAVVLTRPSTVTLGNARTDAIGAVRAFVATQAA